MKGKRVCRVQELDVPSGTGSDDDNLVSKRAALLNHGDCFVLLNSTEVDYAGDGKKSWENRIFVAKGKN